MRLTIGAAFFPRRIRSAVLRYSLAVLAMGIVLLLTVLFWSALGSKIPIGLVFFGIAITAWYAGREAGFVAALLGILVTDVIAAPPHPILATPWLYTRLFAFTLLGLMVSALRDAGDRYRRDQDRLLELERQARAAAEESARLHQQVEDRLTVLVEASGALLTSLESTSVLNRIMELAKRFVEADAYAIWRKSTESGSWEIVLEEGLSENHRDRFFEGMREIEVDAQSSYACEDLWTDPRFAARLELYKAENIRSLLLLGLRIREETPGAISFYYRSPHYFQQGEVRVAMALANLAGSALLLAELYEEQIRLRADAQDVTEALQHSNEELQQFAYVVSHDLQEPLRMVTSYVRLLSKRYQGKLDPDADEFIGFVVGGVERMQNLIRDLLAYSRVVNAPYVAPEPVALDEVIEDVILNLHTAIERSGATITYDPLPLVKTGRTQLTQLLQNLVGNALKYRRDEAPKVHVSAEPRGREWVVLVKDNGLGVDERHYDRIFGIFKRLHGPEYPGTGIGLAIAKRIVERNRGRIWVDSVLGEGSTFCFTVPADLVVHSIQPASAAE